MSEGFSPESDKAQLLEKHNRLKSYVLIECADILDMVEDLSDDEKAIAVNVAAAFGVSPGNRGPTEEILEMLAIQDIDMDPARYSLMDLQDNPALSRLLNNIQTRVHSKFAHAPQMNEGTSQNILDQVAHRVDQRLSE